MTSHDGSNPHANLSDDLLVFPLARIHLAGEEEFWLAIGLSLADAVLLPDLIAILDHSRPVGINRAEFH
jgi:hypothetical protein